MYSNNGWYIVFTKTNKRHWLLSRLRGSQHCFAMSKSPGGSYWVIVNPSWTNICVEMAFVEDCPTPQDYWGADCEVIAVEALPDSDYNRQMFGVFTCVSIVKGLLGINKRFIITPNQLKRYIKNGI